jgi:hypothetical protein
VARDAHQLALEQPAQHGADVHAAHVLDLGAGRRLPVGHDRERLERGRREAQRTRRLDLLQVRRELGQAAQLVAPGDLPDLEGTALRGVLGVQLLHQLAHRGELRLRDHLGEPRRADRLGRREDQGLDEAALLRAVHGGLLT